jgi:heme/copper-type cytochrome/quinol oxidase subunit 2
MTRNEDNPHNLGRPDTASNDNTDRPQAHHRASGLQIWLTAIGATIIVVLLLYGITSQREETRTAAVPMTQTTPAATGAPSTTGQGSQQ